MIIMIIYIPFSFHNQQHSIRAYQHCSPNSTVYQMMFEHGISCCAHSLILHEFICHHSCHLHSLHHHLNVLSCISCFFFSSAFHLLFNRHHDHAYFSQIFSLSFWAFHLHRHCHHGHVCFTQIISLSFLTFHLHHHRHCGHAISSFISILSLWVFLLHHHRNHDHVCSSLICFSDFSLQAFYLVLCHHLFCSYRFYHDH